MVFTTFVVAAHLLMQSAQFQLSIPGLEKAPTSDSVVAKVNGVAIKAKDIEDLLWDVRGEEIITDIADYQVVKAEADKRGVIVTEGEIESQVTKYLAQMKKDVPAGQTFEGAMAQAGLTKQRLFLRVKSALLLTKVALLDFDPKRYVRVSTIVVRPRSSTAADISSTIAVVQKAYDRLKAGEPWPKLVDELVVDQHGKETRGLLGWRQLIAFPETVQGEINTLKKGDITKPVQTNNGIQIFRVEAKGDDVTKAELDQMKSELSPTLMIEAQQRIFKDLKIERLYPATKVGG